MHLAISGTIQPAFVLQNSTLHLRLSAVTSYFCKGEVFFGTGQGVSRPVVQPGKVLSGCTTGC